MAVREGEDESFHVLHSRVIGSLLNNKIFFEDTIPFIFKPAILHECKFTVHRIKIRLLKPSVDEKFFLQFVLKCAKLW